MGKMWRVGDRVLAWWAPARTMWYPATIRTVETERYYVDYDDGGSCWVLPDQLKPLEIQEGLRIECRWQEGDYFYGGVIDKVEERRVHIAYDDGTNEWTDLRLVRVPGEAPPSAKTYLLWTNPEAEEETPSLVRLTPEGLLAANIPAADLTHTVDAVISGKSVPGKFIPLSTLVKMEGEKGGTSLTVTYQLSHSKNMELAITMADVAKRDELMDSLQEQLGADWHRRQWRASRWSAGWWPTVSMVVVAFFTWIFYTEALRIAAGEHLEAGGGHAKFRLFRTITHWIEGLIGPTGVLIVGAILFGLVLWWFIAVMIHPPVHISIERAGGSESASPVT